MAARVPAAEADAPLKEVRNIAVVCRDRSQFSRWVHQRNSGESIVRAEKLDTVYHCTPYSGAIVGPRFNKIIVIEPAANEREFAWLEELHKMTKK